MPDAEAILEELRQAEAEDMELRLSGFSVPYEHVILPDHRELAKHLHMQYILFLRLCSHSLSSALYFIIFYPAAHAVWKREY